MKVKKKRGTQDSPISPAFTTDTTDIIFVSKGLLRNLSENKGGS